MYETDKHTGKPTEYTFIPCSIRKGANISRHNDDTLNIYIPGIKTVNRLLREYPGIFRSFQKGDTEGTLLFRESDIVKAASILKARVMGKNMSPKPKRQIVLSKERKQALSDRMKELHSNKILLEK